MVRLASLLLLALLGGCGTGSTPATRDSPEPVPPPAGAGFDYQLNGDYPLPADATVVVRQWDAEPAEGAYSICYVNAFQTEADGPDGPAAWPDGTVWTGSEDPDWPGEYPIDLSTDAKRRSAAEFAATRFETCAAAGFAAVELDNLDSFSRYPGAPFDRDDAIAYATLLVEAATEVGLAVGQKNTVELLDVAEQIGFAFAIVENCGEYDECRDYLDVYGGRVYAIEYTSEGLTAACGAVDGEYPVILRDLELTAPGHADYRRDTC